MRSILVHTGNRSDYGLVSPVIKALEKDPEFEVLILDNHQLGNTLTNMALSVAEAIKLTVNTLVSLNSDIVLLAGDRYEALGFAIACYYMNIPIAHMFGGDKSVGGNLDDSVRHAITKLSHIHFTTNKDSYERVLALGEEKDRVYNVGSPVVDAIYNRDFAQPEEVEKKLGLGRNDFIIVFTQHPVTTEVDLVDLQILPSLEALKQLTDYEVVITYPNMDAGSGRIIDLIKRYEHYPHIHVHNNLGHRLYLGLLNIAKVMVGNSSSGIMETPAFNLGTVDVGPRQKGRLTANNVISVGYDGMEIKNAIEKVLWDPEFRKRLAPHNHRNPYGYGRACEQIIHVLKSIKLDRELLQKRITY